MYPSVSQLNSFTNILDDEVVEENLSQPLSLPTTCDTLPESLSNGLPTSSTKTVRPLKHTGQHGEFRSVEEIDPKYRCLFTYPYFNLVQSRIIEDALYSDKSMVVCAPTGSGKTVVFELAILQLLMQMEDAQNIGDFKIIYMAPVKAVCNERLTEWYPKLTKLGLLCLEVTGDTEVDFAQLKPYKVIITTPEKWDMLTRRWRDHRGLIEMIKLFLIDEVHILNDETRGPVLEAVVSRMKTVESATQSAYRIEQLQKQYQGEPSSSSAPPRVRFVAVSATVSNPEDVADWLGTSEKPAVFYKFGDECRPVKLRRIVEGYTCAEGTSIFKFDLILNYKLWPIIQKYYNGKPTLIFCNTRKSVALTADALSREVTVSFNPEQKAKLAALASRIKNKKLQMLIMSGVGCHHAGLLYEERVNIEQAFRNRDLPILITTTTLAMGVNLPAHLVIVKNTQQYVNGAYQEYSISTVLQMVGRAGRPQFDTEATAVIMTRLSDKPRYQALVGGSEPLQSYLHKRIAENLNSEAALGTVTDVAQCVEWLRSTFLYVRAAKDPKRYLGLPPAAPMQLILKKIEELCVKAMNSLASSGLITMDDASCIESTEAGRLMSSFYLDVETMKNIMKIEGIESLERLLWIVCESHELSDMYLRMDERRCLNLLNRNNTAATIRFPMKGKISTRQMKLNCIIQAALGCLVIPEPSLNQEAMKVMRTASRVCKCLVRYVSRPELVSQKPQFYLAILNSIVLSKCIEAHLWENSPYVSKQLKGIGPTFSTLLATAGITSFMLLEDSHPRDLERIMNKGPPAGNMIRKQVSLLPKYQLTLTPIDSRSVSVQLMLLNHAHLTDNMHQLTAGDSHKSYLIVGDSDNHLLLLTQFTDKDLICVYDGTMKYEISRKVSGEHKILVHCVSSTIAGIDVQADYLFLDLEPQILRESDFSFCSSSISRTNISEKQTNITDVYKQRKRKICSENDVSQCKEKIKRDNTLTQKLKALKESFAKTSKAMKNNVDKTTEISNKLLHDLLGGKSKSGCPSNSEMNNAPIENPTVDLTNEIIGGPSEEIIISDDDSYIDDVQFDNILSKIESEISGNHLIPNNTQNTNIHNATVSTNSNLHRITSGHREKIEANLKMKADNIPHFLNESTSSKTNKDSRKRKNLNMKTNFTFIALIEKKANMNEEESVSHKKAESGFSDTIKSEISKFLQRTQNKTNPVLPEISQLIQTSSEHEDLPEVHVKSATATDHDRIVDGYEQDYLDSSKIDEVVAQCIEIGNPRDNINFEENNVNDANNCSGEIIEIADEHANDGLHLKTNIYPEHLVPADSIEAESGNIKSNQILCGDLQDISKLEETTTDDEKYSLDKYCHELTTMYRNPNTAIANFHTPDILRGNCSLENALVPLKTPADHNTSAKLIQNIIVNKTNNNYKDLVPYHHEDNDNNIREIDMANNYKDLTAYNNKNSYSQNSSMPCQGKRVHFDDIFDKDDMMVDKFMIPNEYDPENVSNNIEENYIANWNASREMVPAQSNANILSLTCNQENYPPNKSPANRFAYSVTNKNQNVSHTKSPVEQKRYNQSNQDEAQFKRYSYTATKVDVCTRKYTPDHELRITRKLKMDLDITEIVKNNVTKTNKVDPGQHVDIKHQQKNTSENLCANALEKIVFSKDVKPSFNIVPRNTNNNVSHAYTHSGNKAVREIRLRREGNFESEQISSLEDDKCNFKSTGTVMRAETSIAEGYNNAKNYNASEISVNGTEGTTQDSVTNNKIENILQKYSKILVKSQTNSPIVNKINKPMNGNSTSVDKSEPKPIIPKSRKPFRIGEINNLNVSLPVTLTNANRLALNTTPTPIQAVTLIKHETPLDLESYAPNETNINSKTNDRSLESPNSVDSLKLDPIEDIKEESMLNPKLLLQYFSEGNKDTNTDNTDIIAPPATFCDDVPVYTPTASPDFKTDFDEDCSGLQYSSNHYVQNMGDKFDDEKKDIETWCLSRDDESDTYTSQPVPSAPWVISRQHGSQVNANLGSRRGNLCQFKFVRKKPLKH